MATLTGEGPGKKVEHCDDWSSSNHLGPWRFHQETPGNKSIAQTIGTMAGIWEVEEEEAFVPWASISVISADQVPTLSWEFCELPTIAPADLGRTEWL